MIAQLVTLVCLEKKCISVLSKRGIRDTWRSCKLQKALREKDFQKSVLSIEKILAANLPHFPAECILKQKSVNHAYLNKYPHPLCLGTRIRKDTWETAICTKNGHSQHMASPRCIDTATRACLLQVEHTEQHVTETTVEVLQVWQNHWFHFGDCQQPSCSSLGSCSYDLAVDPYFAKGHPGFFVLLGEQRSQFGPTQQNMIISPSRT